MKTASGERDSIEAHMTIVFAALAVSHWVKNQTGWSIKKFVRTARRYRIVQIRAGRQLSPLPTPLPDDLRHALTKSPATVRTNLSPFSATCCDNGHGRGLGWSWSRNYLTLGAEHRHGTDD
jgi:hypothetical protein